MLRYSRKHDCRTRVEFSWIAPPVSKAWEGESDGILVQTPDQVRRSPHDKPHSTFELLMTDMAMRIRTKPLHLIEH